MGGGSVYVLRDRVDCRGLQLALFILASFLTGDLKP